MKQSFQYAKLPSFQYQAFDRQYQTFDLHSLKFAYYPVFHSNRLTPAEDQDNKEPSDVEPEKGPASDDVAEDGSKTSPEGSLANSEPVG